MNLRLIPKAKPKVRLAPKPPQSKTWNAADDVFLDANRKRQAVKASFGKGYFSPSKSDMQAVRRSSWSDVPKRPSSVKEQKKQLRRAGAKGAAKGGVLGAVIGAGAGSAHSAKGAAIGGVAGLVAGAPIGASAKRGALKGNWEFRDKGDRLIARAKRESLAKGLPKGIYAAAGKSKYAARRIDANKAGKRVAGGLKMAQEGKRETTETISAMGREYTPILSRLKNPTSKLPEVQRTMLEASRDSQVKWATGQANASQALREGRTARRGSKVLMGKERNKNQRRVLP